MIIIKPKIQYNNKIIRPKTQYYYNNQTRHNILIRPKTQYNNNNNNINNNNNNNISKTQYNNSNVSRQPNWISLYIMCPARYKKDYFIKIVQDDVFTKYTF